MIEAVAVTCLAVDVVEGYPILRKVFRHLRKTPRKFYVYIELPAGTKFAVASMVNYRQLAETAHTTAGAAGDFIEVFVPPAFEGGIRIDILHMPSGAILTSRRVHFGGA